MFIIYSSLLLSLLLLYHNQLYEQVVFST